jgi:hypothetical protein
VIVWNRTMKRDAWGQKKPQRRNADEVLRIDAPALRIVSDELWQPMHARLSSSREAYIRRNDGRLWGKPTNGIASKYLLAGMATCGQCGGALTVRSRRHGRLRAFVYACLTNVQRGRVVCNNDLVVPLKDTEQVLLDTLEADVLRPEVVTAAIREAMTRLELPGCKRDEDRERLRATVARLDAEIARLTEALASGGSLPTIVAAIREREAQRTQALHDVAARRVYGFSGVAVLDRLLSGIVLPKALVAPTGFARGTVSLFTMPFEILALIA